MGGWGDGEMGGWGDGEMGGGYRVYISLLVLFSKVLIPLAPLTKGGTGFKVPLISSATARQRGDLGFVP
uniref:Uncharacterized protein n=1 Tax=Desertifilum tharense IPPAS B-1220 TaxID=1781255 RepID=A0ACD5GZJ6_9CYAN